MPENTHNEKKPNRRTQVKELPKEEKELGKDEQKKVKGGAGGGEGGWPGFGKPPAPTN